MSLANPKIHVQFQPVWESVTPKYLGIFTAKCTITQWHILARKANLTNQNPFSGGLDQG